MTHVGLLVLLLLGCGALGDNTKPKNCDPRIPFWPDTDQDGFGDPGSTVYLGCTAPDGYTDNPPATDTDGADSDVHDSEAYDTDVPVDSDVHTDPPDSDGA